MHSRSKTKPSCIDNRRHRCTFLSSVDEVVRWSIILPHDNQPRFIPNDPSFSSQWHLQNTGQGSGTVGEDANVTGATKFAESSRFEQNINVGGAATVGGALTVTGNAYFNGNVDIGGDLTFDEVNARNLNITGIATLGFSTAANAYVAGITTSSLLHVGMGATMVKVQGTPATRVGINSVGPAFTLDVDGDSNVTGTIRQGGTSVLTTASGDATALAIALG